VAAVAGAFLDTSVLLPGLIDIGAGAEEPQRILSAIAGGVIRGPRTAWHCCLEFYSVATRLPPEYRLTSEDATMLLEHEILDRFHIGELPAIGRRSFMREAAMDRVMGGRFYDAHIGEVARRMHARIVVTGNRRHFQILVRHGIQVMTPAQFARLL
jgi:hypothetical protein